MKTAKALLKEHRENWHFWSERQRENFIRRCRRLADKLDPRSPDAGSYVMVLDTIATRTGRDIWRGR